VIWRLLLGIAMKQAAGLIRLATASGERIRIVRTADKLETCLRTGELAIVLNLEGAEPIDPERSMSSSKQDYDRWGSSGVGSTPSATASLSAFRPPRIPGPGFPTPAGRSSTAATSWAS
jgi:hypothetical protein